MLIDYEEFMLDNKHEAMNKGYGYILKNFHNKESLYMSIKEGLKIGNTPFYDLSEYKTCIPNIGFENIEKILEQKKIN